MTQKHRHKNPNICKTHTTQHTYRVDCNNASSKSTLKSLNQLRPSFFIKGSYLFSLVTVKVAVRWRLFLLLLSLFFPEIFWKIIKTLKFIFSATFFAYRNGRVSP